MAIGFTHYMIDDCVSFSEMATTSPVELLEPKHHETGPILVSLHFFVLLVYPRYTRHGIRACVNPDLPVDELVSI